MDNAPEQTYVIFRVVGKEVHPEAISEVTNITPDFATTAGRLILNSQKIATTGIWSIESEGQLCSINDHISYLFDRLKGFEKYFCSLRTEAVRVEFSCVFKSLVRLNVCQYSKSSLKIIHSFGADLDIQYYYMGEI